MLPFFQNTAKWRPWTLALAAVLCLLAALPGRPVEGLLLQPRQSAERFLPLPLGRAFVLRYIHSLERTPVEDFFYVSAGSLHEWRTRTRSHNAGMPVQAPKYGRFIAEGPWMVMEGGHQPLKELVLRVGNEEFGRNELEVEGGPLLPLFQEYPGKQLRLTETQRPFSTILLQK